MDLPDPPEGWTLSLLSYNPDPPVGADHWHVDLYSKEEYVTAWGRTPRFAMLAALQAIEEGDTRVRMSGGEKSDQSKKIIEALGITAPKPFVRRV